VRLRFGGTATASKSLRPGPPVRIGPGPTAQSCWNRLLAPPCARNPAMRRRAQMTWKPAI